MIVYCTGKSTLTLFHSCQLPLRRMTRRLVPFRRPDNGHWREVPLYKVEQNSHFLSGQKTGPSHQSLQPHGLSSRQQEVKSDRSIWSSFEAPLSGRPFANCQSHCGGWSQDYLSTSRWTWIGPVNNPCQDMSTTQIRETHVR
jgi:hypothetical protein